MKNRFSITLWAAAALMAACADLDIAPKNIVGDEDLLGNESGISVYRARMYSQLPIQDFKYRLDDGGSDVFYQSWLAGPGNESGETYCRDGYARTYTGGGYWGGAFELLRQANYLMEKLPQYKGNFTENTYNHFIGEAYFVRAFVFYELAKRYGGIPLVTRLIPYPAEASQMEVPRSSEEDTWNQILADFDEAARLMNPQSMKRGEVNKYVALAYKSEAMLYAGSAAKYNEYIGLSGGLKGKLQPGINLPAEKIEVTVMGFERGADASKRYFGEAYKAAREVMESGKYSLYGEGDADAQTQYSNMEKMFRDLTSKENIFVREYLPPSVSMHSDDAYNSPLIYHAPLSSGACVPLDYLELFDGFERYTANAKGYNPFKVTDGASPSEGKYLLFDDPMDFFKKAEPRARAYIIFPNDYFKRDYIEIKMGTYTAEVTAGGSQQTNAAGQPFYTSNLSAFNIGQTYADADKPYTASDALKMSKEPGGGQVKVPYDKNNDGNTAEDEYITASGANGPFLSYAESAITGLYRRKWLDPNLAPNEIGEGKSSQPFVLMRYAEVLLNAAEAAVELALAGTGAPAGDYAGDNLQKTAEDAIQSIQKRAGANVTNITADQNGLLLVRKERRKELFCEFKAVWDLRRWRVQHYDASAASLVGRNYFYGEKRDASAWSSNGDYRFRALYPFFSTTARKWFFDARFRTVSNKTFGYNTIDYYFAIPGGEVTKSPYIVQQPNR